MTMPAYEALALDIKARGIDRVFGLMSDDTALLITTLDGMGVRFVGARHENNAIAMAEGYASATGRLGVAIIGRGPATANALHGAMFAQRSGSRVLLVFAVSSNLPAAPGAGPSMDPKAFNALGVMEAAGFKTFVAVSAQSAVQTLDSAIQATMQGGCAALLLPMNCQTGKLTRDETAPAPPVDSVPQPPRTRARAAAVEAAAAILSKSRRPLFVVGLGAHRSGAREAIEALAERVGAVIATTLKAKDMFRGHPYDLGIVGSFSHAAARRLIDEADCIVAFGAGLNNRTTSYGTSLPAQVPLIQIDLARAHVGRWYHVDVELVADAREAAGQLLSALPERPETDKPFHSAAVRERLASHDLASEFEPAPTPRTMDPRSLAIELDRMLPAERNAVYDAGNFLQVVPFIKVRGPGHIKNTVDFASIGMGFGAALGFACGTPDRTTVLFVGDGGFLMTMSELETVAREDIPLVIIVMNDCAYGAELHYLQMRDMPVNTAMFPDVDLALIAQAFGFEAHTVRTLDELRKLAPLLANPDGPILLDCKINASVAAAFHTESAENERRSKA